MKSSKLFHLIVITTLMCGSVARAQEGHQHDAAERLGHVSFQVSCNAAAQNQFNHALALLHSFQYPEAEKAFTTVGVTDPTCAMSYWGIAMSHYHPLWEPPSAADLKAGAAAMNRAKSLSIKTQRETDYITALAGFYNDADKLDHTTRARRYAGAMNQLMSRNPMDDEAAIFYALVLNERALVTDEKGYIENKKKASAILNKVLLKEPDHPGVVHYIIHSYDEPQLAYLALPAARRYAKIAPSSPHALHMPSHIFTRLGLWQESIQSNLASAATARQIVARSHSGATSKDELHALDYLIYAYLQGAQDQKAKEVLDSANALSKGDQVAFQEAYAWAAMPARFALERRRWSEAATLTLHPADFPWERFPYAAANLYFARAVGAARIGDVAGARREIDELASIHNKLTGVSVGYDWATQVDIQRQAAAAWLAHSEGKHDEALRVMRAAAELEGTTEKHPVTPGAILPTREMLGDLLLELNQSAQALKEYEAVLQNSPNRFNGLYGAARSAELLGHHNKARAYYTKLVTLCGRSDGARPELREAKRYLRRHHGQS